jgi:uncharacterized protein YggU (UPF0235/DUF167 family)
VGSARGGRSAGKPAPGHRAGDRIDDRAGAGTGERIGDRAGAGTAETPAPARTTVAVRVRPGAGRDRVGGRYDGPHGPALIVAVSAPAVDGRATEAVRKALAAALGVRPAEVGLKLGATSRDKVFTVAAPPREWEPALTALLR